MIFFLFFFTGKRSDKEKGESNQKGAGCSLFFFFFFYKKNQVLLPRKNKPKPPREQGERFPSRENSPSPTSRQKSNPQGSPEPQLFPFFPKKALTTGLPTPLFLQIPPNHTPPVSQPAASSSKLQILENLGATRSSGGEAPNPYNIWGQVERGWGGEHGPRTHPAGGILPFPQNQARNQFFPC